MNEALSYYNPCGSNFPYYRPPWATAPSGRVGSNGNFIIISSCQDFQIIYFLRPTFKTLTNQVIKPTGKKFSTWFLLWVCSWQCSSSVSLDWSTQLWQWSALRQTVHLMQYVGHISQHQRLLSCLTDVKSCNKNIDGLLQAVHLQVGSWSCSTSNWCQTKVRISFF